MLLIVHLKGKTVAKSSPLKCEVKVVRFSSHGDAQESADGKKINAFKGVFDGTIEGAPDNTKVDNIIHQMVKLMVD